MTNTTSTHVTKRVFLLALCLAATTETCFAQRASSPEAQAAVSGKSPTLSGERPEFEIRLEILQKLNISARRDGFLAKSNLAPGTVVKKGDVLAKLDTERKELETKRLKAEIAALQNQVADSANLVRAKQEVIVSRLRSRELARASRQTRIPRLEIVEAETSLEANEAALNGEKLKKDEVRHRLAAKLAELEIVELDLKQSTILAPFDGIVFKQNKHVGEAVSVGEPLAEVYRLDYLLGSVLLKQQEISPEQFLDISGKVEISLPREGVRTFEFETPATLPRVERDGRFLAVIKIRNKKTQRGDSWELLPGMQGLLMTDIQKQAP